MSEPMDFAFDVFISYSSRDKAWVRGELLTRIERAGLKAFVDFRDFTRGASSIKEMERGVVEWRKTLLVLTPDYVDSGWGEIENIMVQTLDPANRELRLIPLLKTDCKKPLRIGALTHIDFTDGADLDLAWLQLLAALGKPPGPEALRRHPATELDVSIEIVQPPWSKRIGLTADDPHPYLMILLDGALVTNRETSRISVTFELRCELQDGHPYVIPERSMWDRHFKDDLGPHRWLRGPVPLGRGESATGDLGFICNPAFPHHSDVNMFSLFLAVTDVLSDKSRVFNADTLFDKWTKANVRSSPLKP
jgi:hypothetical protein